MLDLLVTIERFVIQSCIIWSYILPFVLFAILMKNKLNESSDVYEDWYHRIKLWWAKRTVQKYQRKCAEILKRDLQKDAELPKKLTTFKENDSQIIYGTDEQGNMIFLKLTMRENRLVEAVFQLRLDDGTIYELSEHPAILICSISERKWCTKDLEISVVEQFKILKISYNGLLKSVFDKEHHGVRFSFIWTAACRPRYYPYESNVGFLANTVALAKWRDSEWTSILETEFGYDQYGMLIGQIERTDKVNKPMKTVRMTSCRNRFWGKSHVKVLDANLKIFAANDQGMCFLIGIKSFMKKHKHLHYGSVILPNRKTCNIEESSLTLSDFTMCDILPGIYSFTFKADATTFNCKVFTHRHSQSIVKNEEIKGWKYQIIRINIILNETQANGYIVIGQRHTGKGMKLPPFLKTTIKKMIDPQKKFAASITDTESRCEKLAGYLGSNCGLLSSLSEKSFAMPKGITILSPAFNFQVEGNESLKEALQELNDICCKKIKPAGNHGPNKIVASHKVVQLLQNDTLKEEIQQEILKELANFIDIKNDTNLLLRLSYVDFNTNKISQVTEKPPIYCTKIEKLASKILLCWSEAFIFENVKIRRQNGEPILPELAIVIQEIDNMDQVGLLTTMNLESGYTGEIVLTANYGRFLGASEPDTFSISKDSDSDVLNLNCKKLGEKDKICKIENKKLISCHTASELQKTFCVEDDVVIKIARIGKEIETIFGSHRLIEWFISNDKVFLLSSCPIQKATWSNFDLTHEMDVAIMSKNEKISFTKFNRFHNGAMTVLSQSVYLQGLDKGIQDKTEEDPLLNTSFGKIFTSFCHRIGFNDTQFVYQLQRVLKDYYMVNNIKEIIENDSEVVLRKGYLVKNPIYQLVKRFLNYFKFRSFVNEAIVISQSIKFSHFEDPQTGFEKINQDLEKLAQLCKIHLKVSPRKFHNLPETLIEDNKFEDIIVPAAIKRVTLEIFERFEQIKQILKKKKLINDFHKIDIENADEWLENHCSLVLACIEKLQSDFGHRGFKEMDVCSPPWALVDRLLLIKALQLHTQISEYKIDKILNGNSFGFLNKMFNKTPYEVTRSKLASTVHNLRLSFLNLAEILVSKGILPKYNFIFHLTHHELGLLTKDRNPDLIQKAFKRMELFDNWESLEIKNADLNSNINMDASKEINTSSNEDLKLLGTTVVPGNITGRVCVIKNVEDFYNLNFGDIVLTKYTDFGWTIFLQSISGIIIESTDTFAEGPVLAEYYKIPCLVGVENVTEYFKTGDNILLTTENYDNSTHNIGSVMKI